ncbi:hypothetical protein [Psychroserpens burtonensis]|uniref:hypothetical protein n=1 Tax=Psychroserpens burtonensis TaxID=49278 RepID=UPI0004199B03|nr:hypothetical protein [Psychroserpens burtonensis]
MKRIITAFIFIGILISCNSSDKIKISTQESSETKTATESTSNGKQLKTIDSNESLIATSLMAAPEESRSKCKVIGYNMAGEFVTLREGDNEFIVLADNPNQDGFNAACYHKDLEPFMARGRALRAEGKTGQEIFDMREAEMKSGQLKISPGLTLHIYYGAKTMYDPETSKVEGAQLRYVVYMPWATAESTGLPAAPMAPNHPWIMNPGTHRAHIMISPLPEEIE